ncbi:aminotransferase class IV [Streptomyces sp.]|uniref:aminotransferase class IV n=1 Tax=Streptomyces sp. TaxID=1931 RepID=UPI002F40C5BB
MTESTMPVIEIDGRAATVETLWPVVGGYGHFTAMQVRGGRVRGLSFHTERLEGATRELFGTELDAERVRGYVRHALGRGGSGDASVRVNVFQPVEGPGAPVAVMVSVRPPVTMSAGLQRVKSVPYQRPAAHLKHVGGFGQAYYGRRVAAEGYDEALLVGPGGEIAEGAITNIGFVAGDMVVWPDAAPYLRGVTMRVLERELGHAGVPQTRRPLRLADVTAYDGAFLANARGTAVVAEIDGVPVPTSAQLLARIAELYESTPWDEI